jgi:putative oxygen-independent coproporphyrinogen III oxidase
MTEAVIPVPLSATSFGVYVHWPFCAAKCPYCDFNSHVRHEPPDEVRFAKAIARELRHFAALTPDRTVTSVFLGGGTPSLMQAATVEAVLETIARLWPVAEDAEITLEANPGSAEAERFRGYRAAGVNRLSLGVQSLDDAALKALGRIHSVAEARTAVTLARNTFPRLSFDLIYARPAQTPRAWRAELDAAIDMAADHLSLYQLTIEPETMYFRLHQVGKLAVPDGELAAELYTLTQEITEARGIPAYEISNHAAPGAESRHNLTYWRYQDYVGVGPGAHGRVTVDGVKRATASERHPENWLNRVEENGHALVTDETLTLEEAADEMLLMGLRLREGVPADRYRAISGRSFSPARLDFLREHGLIEATGDGRLRTTLDGWLVLDSVVADLAA